MKSFMDPSGALRVVIATIAFGLGVDCPNIRTILHWGATKSIDAYTQETGRSGRDGLKARAILYLSKSDQMPAEDSEKTSKQDQSMKAYCTNKTKCRRLVLMSEFALESDIKRPQFSHDCCDICQEICTCETCTSARSEVSTLQKKDIEEMEVENTTTVVEPLLTTIPLETQQHVELREKLYKFRESLCSDAVSEDGHTLPLLFGIELVTGLHDKLIDPFQLRAMECNYSVLTSGGRKGVCLATKCITVNGKVHVINRWLCKYTTVIRELKIFHKINFRVTNFS